MQNEIVTVVVGKLFTESSHCIHTPYEITGNKPLQGIDECHLSLITFGKVVNNCIILANKEQQWCGQLVNTKTFLKYKKKGGGGGGRGPLRPPPKSAPGFHQTL